MPTNPFDLDSLDLQVSPIPGSGDLVEPEKTPIGIVISLRSWLCCVAITAAFSCVPGATGCR